MCNSYSASRDVSGHPFPAPSSIATLAKSLMYEAFKTHPFLFLGAFLISTFVGQNTSNTSLAHRLRKLKEVSCRMPCMNVMRSILIISCGGASPASFSSSLSLSSSSESSSSSVTSTFSLSSSSEPLSSSLRLLFLFFFFFFFFFSSSFASNLRISSPNASATCNLMPKSIAVIFSSIPNSASLYTLSARF